MRVVLSGLAGLLAAALLLGWLLTDATPRVVPLATASPETAQRGQAVAKRTLRLLSHAPNATRLELSRAELDALPALLLRAYPRLALRLDPSPRGVLLRASLQLPDALLGRFLSLQLWLTAGAPPRLQGLRIGSLALPDPLSNALVSPLLDRLVGSELRLALLRGVALQQSSAAGVELLLTPPPNPEQHASRLLQRLRSWGDAPSHLNPAWIAESYTLLLDEAAKLAPEQWVSLSYFLAPLFRQVAATAPPGQEHLRSRAAILALAIYLGDPRFEQLTGPVLTPAMRRSWPHQRTLLRQRADLRQHFIYSAAIEVLTAEGLSYALGELKELLDANPSGSGFSFADLAADRAGTLFAQRATADPAQARQLLSRFAQPLREAHLIIPVERLPEGLDAATFRQRYRDIDSADYRRLVAQIDQRLQRLRLYRSAPP